jgi:hypothetical protein
VFHRYSRKRRSSIDGENLNVRNYYNKVIQAGDIESYYGAEFPLISVNDPLVMRVADLDQLENFESKNPLPLTKKMKNISSYSENFGSLRAILFRAYLRAAPRASF